MNYTFNTQLKNLCICVLVVLAMLSSETSNAQEHSIARIWNEELLEAIRHDLSRPTIHARNLFHTSVVMYDAWAVHDEEAEPYLLGKVLGEYESPFEGYSPRGNVEDSRTAAISYAAYRLLSHRFKNAPKGDSTLMLFDMRLDSLGYDKDFTSVDYSTGDGRALGNYIAEQMINYGLQDGSQEAEGYANKYYNPANSPKSMHFRGNRRMEDPNKWQPLALRVNMDKGGTVLDGPLNFISPEWGAVQPFSLKSDDRKVYYKDTNQEYIVYHDPGPPPLLDSLSKESTEDYKWGFLLVSQWSSHLDPQDTTAWDISPASMGNLPVDKWPKSFLGMRDFYKLEGGDGGLGHDYNPLTGKPYEPNKVLRSDYTRVLAEFWADGPDSETPPGHWFTILNYVTDHPKFERKYRGVGPKLDRLEWDVKSYFILGGTMHDAAIAAWSIKGYYDYVRPVSALRYMAEKGQSTDPNLPNYHIFGLPLIEGYSELVKADDPLTELYKCENLVKLNSWRGHSYIKDVAKDVAGVGWILAKDWWPYQRQTFITPPFAGYVSGHSTFSRAAAEVMTTITGSEYFPGGMGTFNAKKEAYLKFENGPSTDVQLQWATYRDASDQTSLSRIWGGIHPPADDIPGRRIGLAIGQSSVSHAEAYFNIDIKGMVDMTGSKALTVEPFAATAGEELIVKYSKSGQYNIVLKDLDNKVFYSGQHDIRKKTKINLPTDLHAGVYNVILNNKDKSICHKIMVKG